MNILNHFSKKQLVQFGIFAGFILVTGIGFSFFKTKFKADQIIGAPIVNTATLTYSDGTQIKTVQSNTVTNSLSVMQTTFHGGVSIKNSSDKISDIRGTLCQVSGAACNDKGSLTINSTTGAFLYASHLDDGWYGVRLTAYNGSTPDPALAPETSYFHVVNASMPLSGYDLSTITVREVPVYQGTLTYQGWNINPYQPSTFQGTVCDFKLMGTGPISMSKTVMSDNTLRVYSEDLAPAGTRVDGKVTLKFPYGVSCTNPNYIIGTTAFQANVIHTMLIVPPVNFRIDDATKPVQASIGMIDGGAGVGSIVVNNFDASHNSVAAKIRITRRSNGVSQTTSAYRSGTYYNLPYDTYDFQSFTDDGTISSVVSGVTSSISSTTSVDLHLAFQATSVSALVAPDVPYLAELLDSHGTALLQASNDNHGRLKLSGNIDPGTYVVRVTPSGDYAGYYATFTTPEFTIASKNDQKDIGLIPLERSESKTSASEPPASAALLTIASILPADTTVPPAILPKPTTSSIASVVAPDATTTPTAPASDDTTKVVPLDNGLITGTITDNNNKPVGGADVVLLDSNVSIASSKTNSSGKYALSSTKIKPTKQYALKITKGVDYTKTLSFIPNTANSNIAVKQNNWFVRTWLRVLKVF